MKEIWKTIEDELTGEFARGYALATYLEEHDIKRECKTDGELLGYEWGDFSDYGESSPQEWRDETGYIICTDEEADELAYEYIADSVWAFTPSFLSAHTGVDSGTFRTLQESLCENANEAITAMIKDFDHFVDDAVSIDGRGHFLAQYDHEEHEVKVGDKTFYIYRVD